MTAELTREIVGALEREYELRVARLEPLALGADPNTAAHRAVDDAGAEWLVKLRRGAFQEAVAWLPGFLRDARLPAVLAPVASRAGRPWADLGDWRLIVFPFVHARQAREVTLSEAQWRELGVALRGLHSVVLPESLASGIARETWSGEWRARVRRLVASGSDSADPITRRTLELVHARRGEIESLVDRAEALAAEAQARGPASVLCHTDIHAANVLVDERGAVHIVDWDAPLLAPKERDLMFFGGAQGWRGVTPEEEERLFYRGYGEVTVDREILAYYRHERIVQDVAIYLAELLSEGESRTGRAVSLRRLSANFLPGGTLERARAT